MRYCKRMQIRMIHAKLQVSILIRWLMPRYCVRTIKRKFNAYILGTHAFLINIV